MDASKPIIPPLPSTQAPTTSATQAAASATDVAAAHKTAEDFEAFFLSQAMDSMFAGINGDPVTGGGQSETVYRSLLLQQYAKVAAKSGGIGIADAVQREILRIQEAQKK
ncbi:MAG TPA: rod-binding protein [Stellaceae bacterium]|nr:rod-binding protein [Stellaceae bacterium]